MMSLRDRQNQTLVNTPAMLGGLPVRTNVRAGLAWDDLDDKAKELLDKLKSAVSSVTSSTPSTPTTTAPSA